MGRNIALQVNVAMIQEFLELLLTRCYLSHPRAMNFARLLTRHVYKTFTDQIHENEDLRREINLFE